MDHRVGFTKKKPVLQAAHLSPSQHQPQALAVCLSQRGWGKAHLSQGSMPGPAPFPSGSAWNRDRSSSLPGARRGCSAAWRQILAESMFPKAKCCPQSLQALQGRMCPLIPGVWQRGFSQLSSGPELRCVLCIRSSSWAFGITYENKWD